LDNRITYNSVLLRQIFFVLLLVFAVTSLVVLGMNRAYSADPYVNEVMALEGNGTRGHAIFQMNCASCHGLEADGEVGPSLRRVSEHRSPRSLIQQVTSGKTPPMPQFQPNSQDMADLLSYLETL